MLAFGVPRSAEEDLKICGQIIPKNTKLILFGEGVHKDPKLFENPMEFKPERFLDRNKDFVKNEYSLLFGIGRRYMNILDFENDSLR